MFQATLDPHFASRVPIRLPEQLSASCPSDFPVAQLLKSAELQLGSFPLARDSVRRHVLFVQNLMGTESDFDVPDTLHARLLDCLNGTRSPNEESFYFRRSTLERPMVKPCLVDPTGLRKTNMTIDSRGLSAISGRLILLSTWEQKLTHCFRGALSLDGEWKCFHRR
jgi:hypothetical protein